MAHDDKPFATITYQLDRPMRRRIAWAGFRATMLSWRLLLAAAIIGAWYGYAMWSDLDFGYGLGEVAPTYAVEFVLSLLVFIGFVYAVQRLLLWRQAKKYPESTVTLYPDYMTSSIRGAHSRFGYELYDRLTVMKSGYLLKAGRGLVYLPSEQLTSEQRHEFESKFPANQIKGRQHA